MRCTRAKKRSAKPSTRINVKTDASRARCDGCGIVYAEKLIAWQMEYRGGDSPVKTGSRKCLMCLDVPNEQARKQHYKPDPTPVKNPRPWLEADSLWMDEDVPPTPVDISYLLKDDGLSLLYKDDDSSILEM